MKKFVPICGAVLLFAAAACRADEPGASRELRRGALLEAAAGVAEVWFGSGAEAFFSGLEATGVGHTDLKADVLAGWTIVPDLYLMAVVEGYSTSFSDYTGAYIRMNSAVTGAGLRWYPSPLGFFMQIAGGAAWAQIDSNIIITGTSPVGYGGTAAIGWDFRLAGGVSFVFAFSAISVSVLNWQSWGGSLSGGISWKSGTSSRR